jgi:hypothetical protein
MRSYQLVVNWTQGVIRPQSFFSIRRHPGVAQRCKMPGSFRLSYFQNGHDVANTKLTIVKEKPKHFKPCLIGKDFKEPGCFFQFYLLGLHSYIRFDECSQVRSYDLLPAQLTQYLRFSHGCPDGGLNIFYFHAMLNLSINTGVQ